MNLWQVHKIQIVIEMGNSSTQLPVIGEHPLVLPKQNQKWSVHNMVCLYALANDL